MMNKQNLLMRIEQFVAQSEGQWSSMRSAHSIAFKQFEHIVSNITINLLQKDHEEVLQLLKLNTNLTSPFTSPFQIQWESETDWGEENSIENTSGSSIFIPIPQEKDSGYLLRSIGYTEPIQSLSSYIFLSDGTFQLTTTYEDTIAEERIWFLSPNVRCRSSVTYTGNKKGIIQTSFATEVKLKEKNQELNNNNK